MKRKIQKTLAILLTTLICFSTGTAYGSDGTTTQAVYEQENYRITYFLTGLWENGYSANIRIENTGDSVIHNWWLTYHSMNEIERIWNAELYDCAENEYIIKNAGWN